MARLAAAATTRAAGMAKSLGARSRAAALFLAVLLSLVHSTSGTDQAPTPYAGLGLSSSVRPLLPTHAHRAPVVWEPLALCEPHGLRLCLRAPPAAAPGAY